MPYNILRFDLHALPFSPTHKGCKLPDSPVTYIIFDDRQIFYVGATKSLFNRWSALKSDWRMQKVIKRKKTKVAWVSCTIAQLSDFEPALIQFLNPKFNLMRRGNTYHHANIVRKTQKKFTRLEVAA